MVERIAGIQTFSHDLSDAVAVALCHQTHHRMERTIRSRTVTVEGDTAG